MPTVGYIGNFLSPYSTENDRRWSLQRLGVNVLCFQENTCTKDDILSYDMDALFYSHTHGWECEGILSVFSELKKKNIPTVAVHLDRWVGLQREKDIGVEATWKAAYQFMADCSPEAVRLYKQHNLSFFYSPPAVVERDCYIAPKDPIRFPHEIVFIGSKSYHPEYPFRQVLIEYLSSIGAGLYGNGFPNGVVRGHDLNVLCSTALCVVGDSCFGGRPYYVSDRYYEVRGRGGLLLHPAFSKALRPESVVDGIDTYGVIFYKKESIPSLQRAIAFALSSQKERTTGFVYVSSHETYTQRMRDILEIVL